MDELFPVSNVAKDLSSKNEVPTIDSHSRFIHILKLRHHTTRLCMNYVGSERVSRTQQPCYTILFGKPSDVLRKSQIRQTIGVVGQKYFVLPKIFLNGSESLTNTRIYPVYAQVIRQSSISRLRSSTCAPPF